MYSFPGEHGVLKKIRSSIESEAASLGFTQEAVEDISCAVDEICANITPTACMKCLMTTSVCSRSRWLTANPGAELLLFDLQFSRLRNRLERCECAALLIGLHLRKLPHVRHHTTA